MSERILARIFPRQSPSSLSSAILFVMSFDAGSPPARDAVAPDTV
jgi:hypothetical protein